MEIIILQRHFGFASLKIIIEQLQNSSANEIPCVWRANHCKVCIAKFVNENWLIGLVGHFILFILTQGRAY